MAVLLLKNYARVNFKDIVGQTALMYAVRFENKKLVRYLLCFRANPFFCIGNNDPNGLHAKDICDDFDTLLWLKKAMWLRIGLLMIKDINKKNEFWIQEAINYWDPNNELKMPSSYKFC